MQLIVLKHNYINSKYRLIIDTIVNVCKEHNMLITEDSAIQVWKLYSQSFSSTWYTLIPSDIQLLEIIKNYTEEKL
jgi:hypothetical protein